MLQLQCLAAWGMASRGPIAVLGYADRGHHGSTAKVQGDGRKLDISLGPI